MVNWNVTNAPITVIPTCVDMKLFDPAKISSIDRDTLRENLGISRDAYVLLYLGSWGTWYLTREMLDFFCALKRFRSESKFLIVTNDPVDLINCPFRDDVVVTRSPRLSVPKYISISSASVCFIKPSYSKKASSATKLAEILAMKVPVITNPGWGDVETIFSGENRDHLVNSFSALGYRETIETLISGKLSEMNNDLDEFSLSHGVLSYSNVYESFEVSEI
ncbi:hypothetical protein WSM22_13540 [Cytophagales bacterium WSM2-2]|nr:hypothetical protein WSM22_13540 [Cytophagales bacterium WSM2-2]